MNDATVTASCQRLVRWPEFERSLAALEARALGATPDQAWTQFVVLDAEFETHSVAARTELLATGLAWSSVEVAKAARLHQSCNRFAIAGYGIAVALAGKLGIAEQRTGHMIARTLFYMGETVKYEVAVSPKASNDYRKLHALMRNAIAARLQRRPLTVPFDGREAPCTLESLYFRVLLLARFASGNLSYRQVELLDAWLWMWMPVLCGVELAPAADCLRADLDSAHGLRMGRRSGPGPSLYLPPRPIEHAYRELMKQLQCGQIVPAEGPTAQLRIEEHVAVLDVLRRWLRTSRRAPTVRAPRRPVARKVELMVGLGEITARGLAAVAAPRPAPALSLVHDAGAVQEARRTSDRDSALGEIYSIEHRRVTLVDESDSGLGMEAALADCDALGAGDLVAVRRSPSDPAALGKVVRIAPAKTPGRIMIGVRLLPGSTRVVPGTREVPGGAVQPLSLLFVPGEDASGRHDACLLSDRAYAERGAISAVCNGTRFTFRLNRVRVRGRGWVLAGFEMVSASKAAA